jgi:SAM-dependent methyltransferase
MTENQTVNLPRGTGVLARLSGKHLPILGGACSPDEFLLQVARQVPSHVFLGRSTQTIYLRQVAFLNAVLEDYEGLPAERIKLLDWGCGKGQVSYLLQNRGFTVSSCDVVTKSDDSTFAQQIPIIETKGITVVPLQHSSEMPFGSQSFDCVVSFGVLEHVESDLASLREIRRILKPGGVLFVTFLPYFLSWTQALYRLGGGRYHDRLYGKRQLRSMAESCGFELASVWHGQLFPKTSVPIALDRVLEPVDRFLCHYTSLKYFATNLEALLVAV